MAKKPHLKSVYHGGKSGDKTLIATIYFDTGSSTLTESGIEVLVSVINFIKRASPVKKHTTIYFLGTADHRRTEKYNKDLGFRRAKSALSVCKSAFGPKESFTGITLTAGEYAAKQDEPSWDEMSADRKVEIRGSGYVPPKPTQKTHVEPTYHRQVFERYFSKSFYERQDPLRDSKPATPDVKDIIEFVASLFDNRGKTDVDKFYDQYGKDYSQKAIPIRDGYTINIVDIITTLTWDITPVLYISTYSAKIVYTWGPAQHTVLVRHYGAAYSITSAPPLVRENSLFVLRQIAQFNPLLTPSTPP